MDDGILSQLQAQQHMESALELSSVSSCQLVDCSRIDASTAEKEVMSGSGRPFVERRSCEKARHVPNMKFMFLRDARRTSKERETAAARAGNNGPSRLDGLCQPVEHMQNGQQVSRISALFTKAHYSAKWLDRGRRSLTGAVAITPS
uniref:Uncharacterized protein n=1 Tax=Steinernema glaseri TaxID=37863 RepID=A0A1I7ZB01_9BILA